MEGEQFPYQTAWRNFRRTFRLMLSLIPLMLLVFLLFSFESLKSVQNALVVAGILCVVGIVAVNLRLTFWKCPRCRRFYFIWWKRAEIFFAKRCKTCRLERYEGSSFNSLFT